MYQDKGKACQDKGKVCQDKGKVWCVKVVRKKVKCGQQCKK